MRVLLVCPFPRGSRHGNRVTAIRWRALISELGHEVTVTTGIPRVGYDVLIALHALKTGDAVRWSRMTHPDLPIVVALTGTDLYRDIHEDPRALQSLKLADRLVVLHDRAPLAVPRAFRPKVRVIRQSARPAPHVPKSRRTFDVAFVAHIRPEKDPLRPALAARLLPEDSRVRIVHAGRALSGEDAQQAAEHEALTNPRYVWTGEVAPAEALRLIRGSRLLVLSSVSEGGANVLGEAIVAGTPVVASRIPAAVAALGEDYAGFFAVGDTAALAQLLARAENDAAFLAELTRKTRARRPLFTVSAERGAWRALLAELPTGRKAGAVAVGP